MIRPSQVLSWGEIQNIGEIFTRNLGVKPRIVHFGSHLIFYRAGYKLVLCFALSNSGLNELEVKYFELPAGMRNQGLGSRFFKELMDQECITERFEVIRLIPFGLAARRFWERIGFGNSKNNLYLHYQKNAKEKSES